MRRLAEIERITTPFFSKRKFRARYFNDIPQSHIQLSPALSIRRSPRAYSHDADAR